MRIRSKGASRPEKCEKNNGRIASVIARLAWVAYGNFALMAGTRDSITRLMRLVIRRIRKTLETTLNLHEGLQAMSASARRRSRGVRILARLALAGFALTCGFAHAATTLYKFVDENGVTNITNVPTDKRYRPMDKGVRGPTRAEHAVLRGYTEEDRARYESDIRFAAKIYSIDPALIHAVISAESGYNRFARSSKGAVGLMQLTVDTALRYGVTNRYDTTQNVLGGAHYLHELLAMFHDDMRLALAAYNAGEQSVLRYGNHIPPFPETADYVPRVLAYYKKYRTAS